METLISSRILVSTVKMRCVSLWERMRELFRSLSNGQCCSNCQIIC